MRRRGLVAGLCRVFANRGLRVRPFKPQNMSNNAAATPDGGEIGRAQATQAMAARVEPHVDMNPVLLKPQGDRTSQLIVCGQVRGMLPAAKWREGRIGLLPEVVECYRRLEAECDLVIVEGAGSPAEVNLRSGDIANMGFARAAGVPVVLAGDIDRGGVIASLVGTKAVIDPEDAALIAGFVINKFRGDPSLFDDGYALIEARTGWRGFGVAPWFSEAWKLPAEDALDLGAPQREGGLHVVCLALSRIANFDDLDPLAQEPGVRLTMLGPGRALPGDADLVILPGSKSTRGDLAFLRAQGWDLDLAAHLRRGGHVLGICGGYQMLGNSIADPGGIEGPAGTDEGLGLLEIDTVMTPTKRLTRTAATHCATGQGFRGYEIHIGESTGPDRDRPFAHIGNTPEGATSADGRVMGSYLHGMFSDDAFRAAFLAGFGVASQGRYDATVEQTLDALADHLEQHLDVAGLLATAR